MSLPWKINRPGLDHRRPHGRPARVWGSTYAVTQLWLPPDRPFFAAAARVLPAGLLLLLWVRRLPQGRWWGRALVLGALNHGLFFGLLYVAAFRLPSGLASTLTALSPLVVMGMAFLVLGERQPRVTLVAGVVGVSGVIALVWQNDRAGSVDPWAWPPLSEPLSPRRSVSSWSSAGHPGRRPRHDVVAARRRWSAARARGGRGRGRSARTRPPGAVALLYLGLVGSALGYVLWFRGSPGWMPVPSPSSASSTPSSARSSACVLLSEPFGPVHLAAVASCSAASWCPRLPSAATRRGGVPGGPSDAGSAVDAPLDARVSTPWRPGCPCRAGGAGEGAARPAYGGRMSPVRTASLTTPTGPVEIPTIGFGVWQVPDEEVGPAVRAALDAGYRHIDTARLYGNERGVGRALAACDVPRDDVFVTTKVWNDDHGRDATLAAFDASMDQLGLDVLDLFLIHWPAPRQDLYVETWQALRELRDAGRVRAVGVCNFHPQHLQRLHDETGEWPCINQVELHPYLQQAPLREFHEEHGIVTESWSPLASGRRCSTTRSSGGSPGRTAPRRPRSSSRGTWPSASSCCPSR